jgi:hypothetical protein
MSGVPVVELVESIANNVAELVDRVLKLEDAALAKQITNLKRKVWVQNRRIDRLKQIVFSRPGSAETAEAARGPTLKRAGRGKRGPKTGGRPGAFLLFRRSIKASLEGNGVQTAKAASRLWRNMTETERQPFFPAGMPANNRKEKNEKKKEKMPANNGEEKKKNETKATHSGHWGLTWAPEPQSHSATTQQENGRNSVSHQQSWMIPSPKCTHSATSWIDLRSIMVSGS